MRAGGRPRWRLADRLLAQALTVYEDSLCPECGHDRARAWSPDSEGHWEVAVHHCLACERGAQARKEREAEHQPGDHVGIFDGDPDKYVEPV
jgi:hypothetical protein